MKFLVLLFIKKDLEVLFFMDTVTTTNQVEKILKDTFKIDEKLEFIKDTDNSDGIFETDNDSIIVFNFILEDFKESHLAEYTVLAEDLYEEYDKPVQVYLILPGNNQSLVDSFNINSSADFSITLAVMNNDKDIYHIILDIIKTKVELGILLDEEDISMLKMLPMSCPKQDRLFFREECFKILNSLGL